MRRNLIIVFKPIKSNFVLISELNHRMMMLTDNKNNCLNVTNNHVDFYCSWLPYGSGQSIRDTEIGINASVAETLGLHEGSIVSCRLIEDLPTLDSVYVSATNQKDWEILEAASYRISNTLLDQARVINENKKLIIWVNSSIHITVKIDKLAPQKNYGKIEKNTEIVVNPFNKDETKLPKNENKTTTSSNYAESKQPNRNETRNSLYDRLYKKEPKISTPTTEESTNGFGKVIDSRTLSNVSEKSASSASLPSSSSSIIGDDSSSESDAETFVDAEHSQSSSRNGSCEISSKRIKIDVQTRLFEAMLAELKGQDRKSYKFRAIPKKWTEDSQMSDVFLTKHNTPKGFNSNIVYILTGESINDNDERVTKEIYVNVKVGSQNEMSATSIYPSIEISDMLMASLKIPKFCRVTLSTKKTVLNFVEKIELIPASDISCDKREILDEFKRLLNKPSPLLINQDQVFRLGKDFNFVVQAKIYPESFRYTLCDAEILRENKLFISEQKRDFSNILNVANEILSPTTKNPNTQFFIDLRESKEIIGNCVHNIIINNCLDAQNRLRRSNNYLIIGSQTSGKSTICTEIIKKLEFPPYNCHIELYNCAQNKAKKVDSIQKDLRTILTKCVERLPSILVLENLDAIAKVATDHSQNADYYNQISDTIKYMLSTFTSNTAVSVIATATNLSNLNRRIYTSRGNHIFEKIYKIMDLTKENRAVIIHELCKKCNVKFKDQDFDKLANLTEGYTFGYLIQFIDRAIFYAFRNDNNNPTLTMEVFLESLKTTNAYCLQGIENNIDLGEFNENARNEENILPGLENVVSVFHEVLLWPKTYPDVFENSPLRNQAGILLFGPPGTGKTYLVSHLAKNWNLRMISVKGPELLAKFIGQSEENVRNLFDRARNAKPCVLFFDEFDSIAPRRGHDSTGVTDRVVNQLLTELDGVEELKGVVIVAATSRPDLIDPALLRSGRIDRLVQCSLPDSSEARLKIFKSIAQSSSLNLECDVDFSVFCTDSKSNNYTAADIKSILVTANMIAVKNAINDNLSANNMTPRKICIAQKHIAEAFENTNPSLSYADAMKYKFLYAKFVNREDNAVDFSAQRTTLA